MGTNKVKLHRQRRREQKKRQSLIIAIGVLIVVFLAALVLFRREDNKLLGVWKYDEYTEYEFSKEGKGCLCADDVHFEYKYDISGDKLELDFIEDIVTDCEYTFTIKGDTLTLVGGEGTDGGTYELKKIQE